MKKVFLAMAASVVCLSLVGCKGKSDNNAAATGDAQGNAVEQADEAGDDAAANAGAVVSGELEELYMVCPFMLQVEGETDADGNPVTAERKWICGSSVGSSTVADWVFYTQDPRFAFNVDGWHFVGKDIVNADETYKVVDEDAFAAMSSYCTIRTEKYVKPATIEAYEHNTYSRLYTTDDTEAEAPRLKTWGNRHEYKGDAQDYIQNNELQDRVITSFYLQEWVTVALPAELANQDVTLAVVRQQPKYEGVTFDADRLSESLWTGKPEVDSETGFATVTFYVNEEEPVGFYDLIFISGQKVMHYLTMIMSREVKK